MSALGYAKPPARYTRTSEELRRVREAALSLLLELEQGKPFSGLELKARSSDPMLMERVLKMLERHHCIKRIAGGMSIKVSCDADRIREHVQPQQRSQKDT